MDYCNTNKDSLNFTVKDSMGNRPINVTPLPTDAYSIIYGYQKMGFENSKNGKGVSYAADGLVIDSKTGTVTENEVILNGEGYYNGKGQAIKAVTEFYVPTVKLNPGEFYNKIDKVTIRSELIPNGMKINMVVVDKDLRVYKLATPVTIMTFVEQVKEVALTNGKKSLAVDLPSYGIGEKINKINWAGTEYVVNAANPFTYKITYIIGHYEGVQVGDKPGATSDFVAATDVAPKTINKGEAYEVTEANPVIKVTGVEVYVNLTNGGSKMVFRSERLNAFPQDK